MENKKASNELDFDIQQKAKNAVDSEVSKRFRNANIKLFIYIPLFYFGLLCLAFWFGTKVETDERKVYDTYSHYLHYKDVVKLQDELGTFDIDSCIKLVHFYNMNVSEEIKEKYPNFPASIEVETCRVGIGVSKKDQIDLFSIWSLLYL